MTQGSLFSGIGGFDLASEWMGWDNIFHCEINPFGRKVLNYYWPKAISYEDITKTNFTIHRGSIDIISGGFPCQPFSVAGKRKGKDDDRFLWKEMLRAIREIQPSWIVGENVPGLISWNGGMVLNEIKADLEGEGFEVFQPIIIPACGKDAPHRRDRLWIVAHSTRNSCFNGVRNERSFSQTFQKKRFNEFVITSNTGSNGHQPGEFGEDRQTQGESESIRDQRERVWADSGGISDSGNVTNTSNERLQRGEINGSVNKIRQEREQQFIRSFSSAWENFPTQPPVRIGDDGLSTRLSGITVSKHRNESIKAMGSAIVPQIAFDIFKGIESCNYI
jgi:DNA (cytosine-5)-methyltransferase 1